MTGTRPIPVPNDAQLEHLTQLRIRATERAQRNEWSQQTLAYAMNRVDIAVATVDNCYQVLMGLKQRLRNVRRRLLDQLALEAHHDEQLEMELWETFPQT